MSWITSDQFRETQAAIAAYVHRTPLLTSRLLSERTGFDIRLKAEMFQRTGSYKIRGAVNKLQSLEPGARSRGVICSSAGNHAQGVALAARIFGAPATVVMAENATPAKVQATEAYGARVVFHGTIWDDASAKAQELAERDRLINIHPFDDIDLIRGQSTVGLELFEDFPEIDVAVVPIGGGGLISGVALALHDRNPGIRVIGVESAGAPAMKASIEVGYPVVLEDVKTAADGLRVRRVGDTTFAIAREVVDNVVTVSDEAIFDAVLWCMAHLKVVPEAAAAAPVAALLEGLIDAPSGSRVGCVLSGGNVNLNELRGMSWN